MSDALVCDRCAGAMIYQGSISLPPQTIYGCEKCGNQKWTTQPPPPYRPPASLPVEQPQAQQQQQPQPNNDKKE